MSVTSGCWGHPLPGHGSLLFLRFFGASLGRIDLQQVRALSSRLPRLLPPTRNGAGWLKQHKENYEFDRRHYQPAAVRC